MSTIGDEIPDVIVVGCGYAGAVSAIAAHDAGASVLVLEKMSQPGGISICSAGGIRVANNADAAFSYLVASNAGTTPDDVLRVLAEGMTTIDQFVGDLAVAERAVVERRPAHGNYPYPGNETFGFVTIADSPATDPVIDPAWVKGSKEGLALFNLLMAALRRRGIEVKCDTRVTRLKTDSAGNVVGVEAIHDNRGLTLAAGGGVVLACGGFEADSAMQKQYWQGMQAKTAAFGGNTGDGIRMCQDAGADLWHMWHFHGSYGMCHSDPAYPFAIRMKRFPDWQPGAPFPRDVRMPWILVDQDGRRFMNEYDPYLQDTGARPFGYMDPQRQRYPRIPAWLIADETGRKRHPFGKPAYHQGGIHFSWSEDNLCEVDLGILKRSADIEGLSRTINVPPARLEHTLTRWNDACDNGCDNDFARPPMSMMPIRQPPFYAAEIRPLVNNTQGGPVHDAHQRVLDPFGAPISGLYAAGELGSAFGYLYISGGNIAECFIGGRIAGREAAGGVSRKAGTDGR